MSAYKNFVMDFPGRCMNILEMAEKRATLLDREVTLMLMAASAGILIPFERLNLKGRLPHPSRDIKKFPEKAKRLGDLMEEEFLSSILCSGEGSNWSSGKLNSLIKDSGNWVNLDACAELNENKPMAEDKKVVGVLKIIRNALAHGNIHTKGNPIRQMIFISVYEEDGDIKNINFVSTCPKEFLKFLVKWFQFLKEHKISLADANEICELVA